MSLPQRTTLAIEPMKAADWPTVVAIYREGIATGHATFTSEPPATFSEFTNGAIPEGSLVARQNEVLGWTRITKASSRSVYAGVAEVSLYVAAAARGRGVGRELMRALIARSEAADVWMLQAVIFPENEVSIALHERYGFRVVGRRERMGKMMVGPLAGQWRDVMMLERRSTVAGIT